MRIDIEARPYKENRERMVGKIPNIRKMEKDSEKEKERDRMIEIWKCRKV